MVVSVDVKFVVKSINEHPYHRTVYSYSREDWGVLRDHLRDVLWFDIFKHGATCAAKEITEWVEIGIDCYIPQKFSVKAPLLTMVHTCVAAIAHYFHQYQLNATTENKKLFCDSRNHSERSNYAETLCCFSAYRIS